MLKTHAYPECYVSAAATSLAIALDYAAYDCDIAPDSFAELFVQSGIARLFEEGNPVVVAGMSGVELAHAVLSFVYGETEWPARTMSDGLSPEYWAGWALAQFQWHSTSRFEDIFAVVLLSEVVELYPLYHEMDMSQFYATMDGFFEQRETPTRLKVIRKARGISQQELANLSGVKVRNIQMYEQGHNSINRASGIILYRLAHVLGCTMEDLLEMPMLQDR